VSRIFASWNQLNEWLRQIERLRRAAWVLGSRPSLASRPWKTRSMASYVNDRDLADPEDGFVIVQAEW